MAGRKSNTGEFEVMENESIMTDEYENPSDFGTHHDDESEVVHIVDVSDSPELDEQTDFNPAAEQSDDESTAFVKARMFRKSVITDEGDKLRVLIVVGRTCVSDFYAEGNAENETRKDVSGLFSNVGDTVVTDTYLSTGFKIKAVMWNSLTGEIAPLA